MNGTHFVEWFKNQLLPNLPPHAVIVLDNDPYHNVVTEKVPTKSSKKALMQEWLTRHSIEWDRRELKRELFEKIRKEAPQKKFVVDGMARENDFIVLRSPVAHCELNPIELVWSQVKGFLKKNNKTFRLADLEKLVPEAFDTVTSDIWANCCEEAIKEENTCWESDGLQEEAVNEFLIEFGDSDQDDDLEYVEVAEEGALLCHDESVSDDDELDVDDRELLRIDECE